MTPLRRRLALIVRAEAAADIDDAFAWYEGRSAGLGVEFVRAIDVCLESIRRWPHSRRIAFDHLEPPVRRALARRFPYTVYYVAAPRAVHVLGCLYQHRDPGAIREQVERRARDV